MVEWIFLICILAVLPLAYNQRKRLKKVKLGSIIEVEFEKEVMDQKKKERKPKLQSSTFNLPKQKDC